MPDTVVVVVNGELVTMPAGSMVSAAILKAGISSFRKSVSGEPRGPLCGMGICFECRLKINGLAHRRSCQVIVEDGMKIETDEQN